MSQSSSITFNVHTTRAQLGAAEISFETGKMARQAGGAVVVRMGDTVVLAVATAAKDAKPNPFGGDDFVPLTCDYVEKAYAAGKIPGSYFRREARQNEFEILASRLMDRPIRPQMIKGWVYETQVGATVLSHDKRHESQVLAMNGASAALHISEIPFDGPTAAVRVARIDGQLVANPTLDQLPDADINFLVAVGPDGICMVEGGADFVDEPALIDALLFAQEACQPVMRAIEELRQKCGKPKREVKKVEIDEALRARVRELSKGPLNKAFAVREKLPRYAALDEAKAEILAQFSAEELAASGSQIKGFIGEMKRDIVRYRILDEKARIDGRGLRNVRPIVCEAGVLPRTHGSSLFTRGETQALATVTLGTSQDTQKIETVTGDVVKEFLLHYNFPSFSVGEVKPNRGPGRREIGHGALAQRGLEQILPDGGAFPYTIRIVSEILESNGSSSMATVCSGSMALMDAGVPVRSPVAGIAMGLIQEGDRYAVLSDILGDEDHLGDMDFKVIGNFAGVSALQMDIKVKGLTRNILEEALDQAKEGRLHILGEMAKCIEEPRLDLSLHAPRIFTVVINPEKIRDLIGPGGKHIRSIVDQTGAIIDVTDDGKVNIAASNGEIAQRAVEMVRSFTEEAETGKTYLGIVARVTDFGAFVTIMPGTDGLLHISEMDEGRVNAVEDICREGDEVLVKVVNVDRQGKIRLSRREALLDQRRAAGEDVPESAPRPRFEGGDRPHGGDRGGDRRGGGGGRDRGRSRDGGRR